MALRPTTADLVTFAGLSAPDAPTLSVFGECIEAALELIEARVTLPVALSMATPDPTAYPERIRYAELMLASRLAKRRQSPEGVAGFDLMGVVRILGSDPDIERLIGLDLTLNGFA